jgi:Large polyvalent protein-associated domain 7
MATDTTLATPDATRAENSIRPSKKLRKDNGSPAPTAAAPSSANTPAKATPEHVVPEEVRRRFVQVKNRYYFPDGARAFTDRGTRLTTSSENTKVVRSLIQIAEARGWTEVTVRGTERFRKEAWFAARLAGLEVRGYRPSEFEQGHLVRTLGRQGPAPAIDSVTAGSGPTPAEHDARAPEKRGGLLTGRLVDHGPAPYRHDPHEPMSYFVRLETARGDRTVWGVDLERAFKESLTQPETGDEVGLRSVRQEAVKVRTQKRGEAGELIERDLETHRNHWIIEKRAFFEARAEEARTVRDTSIDPKQAVKNHPELVGTYLQVHAAELAAKQFRDPQDRERFVHKVRAALADAVARGEPLPAVRLRERAAERTPKAPEREAAPVRS